MTKRQIDATAAILSAKPPRWIRDLMYGDVIDPQFDTEPLTCYYTTLQRAAAALRTEETDR